MKSYLKINIYNGKDGFSNLNDGINPFNILEFNFPLNRAKKVLHNFFIDYKKLKKEKNKGEW